MIESLLSSRPSWVQLGLVLAHFLWQGAAIAVVLAAVLWLLRQRSPNARYGVCALAMLTMAVSPILTLWYVRAHPLPILAETRPTTSFLPVSPSDELGTEGDEAEDISEAVMSAVTPAIGEQGTLDGDGGVKAIQDLGESALPVTSDSTVRRSWMALGLELITLAWCVGVVALSSRLLVGWWRLRRHCRQETEALPEATEGIVRRLSRRLGLASPARVLTSQVWKEPIAFGLLRPVVLLPISVLTQCPAELIEAMIAHELAHIRRHDLWVNMLQRVVETLLFYHPAVWWVSGRMRLERELCCDDLAIGATGRRADYATALMELCRMSPGLVTPAMAAGIFGPKLSLLTRVQRILQVSARGRESNRGRFWLAGPLSILLAGAFVLVAGLRAAAPQGTPATQPAEATDAPAFTATLPGGITVELIGVASNKRGRNEATWWKPDGTPLDAAPYRNPGTYSNEAFPYEFAVKVSGADDFDLLAAAPPGKNASAPNGPRGGLHVPGLRSVVVSRFGHDETETTISLGLAAGPWQEVETWLDYPWAHADPQTVAIGSASGTIAPWPRTEGSAIRADISHTYTDVSTRLIAFDRKGNTLVGAGGLKTPGRGIVRQVYRFDPLAMEDLKGFEFQQRPYDTWITFKNVSLKPGHHSQVQVETMRGSEKGPPFDAPAATRPADAAQRPEEKKTYTFNWDRQPLSKVLTELQEQTGLSISGIEELGDSVSKVTVNFTSVRPVGFDEALLLVNHLIQDKGPGYWILRRDQCLEIRDVVNWFRRIPPAQMFATEEAYRKADLPKWEVASVVYQPRHASAKSLADRAMDEVPDNTARAVPTPDGNRIELKGIVEYIDQQLEIIRKWDVPQDDAATVLRLGKAADAAGQAYSFYGGPIATRQNDLATVYQSLISRSAGPPTVPVHARTDGVIIEVKVKNGQAVKKDDLLARFDDEEIKIDLAGAEIRLQDSVSNHKRLLELDARVGPRRTVVSAEEREKAESAVRLAELDVQRCRLRLNRTQIKSPADGAVVGRGAPENDVSLLVNQQVKAGELLMYIRPAEQAGSTGTTAPKSRLGATPKSELSTRPADVVRLAQLVGHDWPFPLIARDGRVLGLEEAIKEAEAMLDELRSSRAPGIDLQTITAIQEMIDRMRKLSAQSAKGKRVYAQGDGVIAEVKVQDGQMVKKGELLVQLDAAETDLELEAAKVRLRQSMESERLAKLRDRSGVGEGEYDKAVADRNLAEIEIRRLGLRLSRTQITSPADGKVRAVEGSVSDLVGKRVTAGDLMLYVEAVDSVSQADTRPSR